MGTAGKKLVTWKNWAILIGTLLGWSAFRIYRDYQLAGGFTTLNVMLVVVVACVGLLIASIIFWYANRPEIGD